MRYIADLHIHSKYSRACSPSLTPENIAYWAQIKGIDVVSSADFTHPAWFKELENKLELAGNGLYKLRKGSWEIISEQEKMNISHINPFKTLFFISTEVSCVYKKNGQCRRLHICIFAPSLEVAGKINEKLGKIGNLKADGRPILGLDAKELAKIVFAIDERCMIIPAHAWTPWFAVFGSKSGFNTLEECFDELTPKIFAIETGLSSDPAMNWQISKLDNIALISNSDAHSPANLGREANVFEFANGISYDKICGAIKNNDRKKFLYTIEFYPEEGMYHFDGHRDCKIVFDPDESKHQKNICPVCKKPLTIGVANRVKELADREFDKIKPEKFRSYKSLVGLDDVIAESLGVVGRKSKAVMNEYKNLIEQGKSEFNVLLNLISDELLKITSKEIVEAIERNRDGRVKINPGYDGVYGEVRLFSDDEKLNNKQQKLF